MNEETLANAALERLSELGLHGEVLAADQVEPAETHRLDAVFRLTAGSGAARTYGVEIRARLTPESATSITLPARLPPLLVTTHVTEPVAERLRAQGIDYVDTAGNARLAWGDVLIDVRGRRNPVVPRSRTSPSGAGAFGRAGLRVVFVLLSWPEMAAQPYRVLAGASGVSLGTVKAVIDELGRAGYLYSGAKGRRMARGGELLDRWAEAYSITLHTTLALGEFSVDDLSWWPASEAEMRSQGIQVGGEAGAGLIDPHLRPATLTLYAEQLPARFIAGHRMARAEDRGNVHIRKRFWRVAEPDSWIVPSPLIYADLLASGDPRQREHGDRIRTSDDRLIRLGKS
ncbi:type IV toxin-antitoxin system AbiEi family antitoxin [Amycolatopsis sp. RTGN1]|uniref:type IV toxin-antitoxin system AbiEi family antitoxin n=1 Tax=Amycolatopsis ponsaeliensis TaxID=2992142 RepID=UPI002550D398|nr:type IV toxin-antitoxin system AbiEi family antitoxin [Amycolatopsis sp. RTGN1]